MEFQSKSIPELAAKNAAGEPSQTGRFRLGASKDQKWKFCLETFESTAAHCLTHMSISPGVPLAAHRGTPRFIYLLTHGNSQSIRFIFGH